MKEFDVVVIGAGIVGLATANEVLSQRPGLRLLVVEKEPQIAMHQTGRNSGVVHSGIYYAPGSSKARLARAGCASIKEFCREHSIPCRTTGKLIVALGEHEIPGLLELKRRGDANEVESSVLDPSDARQIEPAVNVRKALFVPSAGVVDYRRVAEKLRELVDSRGGETKLSSGVRGIDRGPGTIELETTEGRVRTERLINAGGLFSDRIAKLDGVRVAPKITPFRGEYKTVRGPSSELVRGLIYPVPDVRYPFLGVHLTRSIDGTVHAGPNAVLALAREGYRWSDISPRDLLEQLMFPGLWRLLMKHPRMAYSELRRSISHGRFARSVRRLVPAIDPGDLEPSPAGVRAQALTPRGDLVDDFLIEEREGAVHVMNAPSPAATSALEIARVVASRLG
ncbi:MAG: L-2-hydroxyglutarate oxidase [Thermoanaerobaculia bacterium]|nr:L-2-hydroxyglutarate oxidase [Thermoanaerobaculia bacterium]